MKYKTFEEPFTHLEHNMGLDSDEFNDYYVIDADTFQPPPCDMYIYTKMRTFIYPLIRKL